VYDFRQTVTPLDEQAPIGAYWRYSVDKLACESVYQRAHADRLFNCTVFRPSHVYSDTFFVHQFGFDGALLINRIARNAPALVFDAGQQLWQACHQDDAGIAFAHACLRERCYGRVYNVGYKETFSWKQCYERIARAFGATARIMSLPADTLPLLDAPAYEFLTHVTRYHFVVDPSLLYQHIPEFYQRRSFEEGALAFGRNYADERVIREYDPLLTELMRTKATTV
jgi:nucleoside-diphosphate-sugar epimerase